MRNISVGYTVEKFERIDSEIEGQLTLRAVQWTPHELSLVPIPADAGSQVRDLELQENPTPIRSQSKWTRPAKWTRRPLRSPALPHP